MNSGIYIHIPFCVKKCEYCDFYSIGGGLELYKDRYIDALIRHIDAAHDKNLSCDSVYFGGGTPSLLEKEDFEKLIGALKNSFDVKTDCEISIEANPGTITEEKLYGFRTAGINRISIGIQSVNDNELRYLGRMHDSKMAKDAVDNAARCGFDNISCDIMFGIPLQTIESFKNTLETVSSFNIEHISAYGLKIEPSTPFFNIKPELPLPNEDIERDMYFKIIEVLKDYRFNQYEISNFAKSGFECRHNLKYWLRADYLSFGPGAASFIANRRYTYQRDINRYISAVCNSKTPPLSEDYVLTPQESDSENIMLNLRLSSGLDITKHNIDTKKLLQNKKILRLAKEGFLNINNNILALTPKGFYISNAIIIEIEEMKK